VKLDLFTAAELRQVIDLASTRREWFPFALCAAVGCRIGESIAVPHGNDYDAASGELSITRTWTRSGYGPPKSERGVRTIRVPDCARPVMESDDWPTMQYSTAHYRWGAFLKLAGLRHRNLHQLRHSVASHALAAGVPLPNVARDLGDTVQTVVNTYLHPTPGADVCEAMSRLLGDLEPAKSKGRKSG
jgi:integrase